jgi:hypothetical protein
MTEPSNLCPQVNIDDHVASRIILDCVHMSKQTWPWVWSRDMLLCLLDTCDSMFLDVFFTSQIILSKE